VTWLSLVYDQVRGYSGLQGPHQTRLCGALRESRLYSQSKGPI
jgi:hypothetical protein